MDTDADADWKLFPNYIFLIFSWCSSACGVLLSAIVQIQNEMADYPRHQKKALQTLSEDSPPCSVCLVDRGNGQCKWMEEVPCHTSLAPLAFPCFLLCLTGLETEGLINLPGEGGDHFHCTVEPLPGHIRSQSPPCLPRLSPRISMGAPQVAIGTGGGKYPRHQKYYIQLFLFSGINFLKITITITFLNP